MVRDTYRNRMQGAGGACCSACTSHMGATPDTFQEFLAANPDLAAQVTQYQQQNPGDPVLQQIVYNPVTNTMGPAPFPFIPSTPTGGTADSSGWGLLTVMAALAGVVLIDVTFGSSSSGRRRR